MTMAAGHACRIWVYREARFFPLLNRAGPKVIIFNFHHHLSVEEFVVRGDRLRLEH